MKIIQSFWSKPFRDPLVEDFYTRSRGGFPMKRYYIYTHALSILQLKKLLGNVHLITDDFGKELLIDTFELPYTSYSTELNRFCEVPDYLWAISKVFVYSIMNMPFIHFDNDVIVGNQFKKEVLENEVVTEFAYIDKPNRYGGQIKHVLQSNANFPDELTAHLTQDSFVYSDYNLGIVGGKDYTFFNEFGMNSLHWFLKNQETKLKDTQSLAFLNCLLEPCYFFQQISSTNKEVTLCLNRKFDQDFDYQKEYMSSDIDNFSFVHLHNVYKLYYYQTVENWLKKSYPQEYNRINKVITNINSQLAE